MKSLFIVAGLFSLALLAGAINARKYPESITQGSVDFGKEFNTKLSLWVYRNDVKSKDENLLVKEIERKSSFWVYNAEAKPSKDKSFGKELKKSNLWVYGDDVKQRDEDENLSMEEFKTKPNLWVYNDDVKPKEEDLLRKGFGRKSSFWVYHDEIPS